MTDRRRLLVGVFAHTDPAGLTATLDALPAAVGRGGSVVIVADGPDVELAAALDRRPGVVVAERAGTAAAWSAAAAVARRDRFDALAFLESGCVPRPAALRHLLEVVTDARTRIGVAGPSTNDAWNVQRVDGVGALGSKVVDLAPLHAITEHCFVTSAAAIDAVGAADAGFGTGPCWEMELAARVARVGLRIAWVQAAYVHRPSPTRRWLDARAGGFPDARRRYQDRLCGLRLDGSRSSYAEHCAGDSCQHFAPLGAVVVRLPLPAPPVAEPVALPDAPDVAPAPPLAPVAPVRPLETTSPTQVEVRPRRDLVSCVMPTADRPAWAARAIELFHRQDHGPRELVVVEDGDGDLRRHLGPALDHPAVVHLRLDARHSIGAKRNIGVARASGDVVVQWDDDDWYGPDRLRRQSEPIRRGDADLTGLRDATWFDLERWRFRRPTAALHAHLFVGDVHGGTLAYRRSVWERGGRYPDLSLAEDAWFLREAVRRGAGLLPLDAGESYLYVRHGTNSWQLQPADADDAAWIDCPEPELGDDRAFYAARSPAATARPVGALRYEVSCIMPTADRRPFVAGAVASFLAQRDVRAELVVVDDGDDRIGDLLPADERIRYIELDRRRTIGAKRNVAVEASAGELIAHLDDDDWSHPDRLRVQATVLGQGLADVCGLARMLWWDPVRRQAWRYTCPPLNRAWVAGNTLVYRRRTWDRRPFPDQGVGEDTAFVWGLPDRRVLVVDDERLVVGTLHDDNTSTKRTAGGPWSPADAGAVERLLAGAAASDGSEAMWAG